MPWGVGCSIVYNYVDLVIRNDTDQPFQLRTWVGERFLHGQLRTAEEPDHSYRVEERGQELVKANCALVVYEPGPEVAVIDLDGRD